MLNKIKRLGSEYLELGQSAWLYPEHVIQIVFDECHRAKNLCPVGSSKPTKTGLTVLELQNKLPKARVVYASATGASEPRNMAYMVRLGMWGEGTPFPDFNDFITAVEKRYRQPNLMHSVSVSNIIIECSLISMFISVQRCRCNGNRRNGYEIKRHVHSSSAEFSWCDF